MNKSIITVLAITLGFASCKMADVRTDSVKSNPYTSVLNKQGRELLEESITAMGYNNFSKYESYSVKNEFTWHFPWVAMPLNSLPGNKKNKESIFRFAVNTFDGQIEYLEGRKKGDIHGIQSWQSYEQTNDNALKFEKDSRRNWGLASYHYLIEAPFRLQQAPIIKYAGEKEFEGKTYDLVFLTWGTDKPHKEHDHWLIYINKETKFIDLTHLTIRDFWMPFPPNMAQGTVRFLERVNVNGIYLPTNVSVQLLNPKKETNYVYKFKLWDYKFDSFDKEILSPNKELENIGDEKIVLTN